MGKIALAVLLASLATAGCGRQQAAGGNATVNAATPAVAVNAVSAQPAAPRAACAPAPALELLPDFEDPRRAFASDSAAFRSTVANFAAAYARSCENGVLRGAAWERLFLKNAPEANIASIYPEGGDSEAAAGRILLEYPFVTADGAAHAPSAEDLAEAIFCTVRGASPQEQEEQGRCLPD